MLASACGSGSGDSPEAKLPDRSPQAPRSGPVAAASRLGLMPLPSRRQVTTAVPQGRLDPFAPAAPPPASPPTAPRAAPAAGAPAAPGTPSNPASATAAGGRAGAQSATPRRPPAPAPLRLPDGFAITGVIASGGGAEALVQLGASSGTVRVGDQGSGSTPWLPLGWRVAGIDVNDGAVTLRHGSVLRRKTISE